MASINNVDKIQKELEVSWMQKMAEFEDRLKAALVPSNPTLVQLSQEFYAFKDMVTQMFSLLQLQVRSCINTIDGLDMRQRQNVLLFNGIPEDSEVSLIDKVLSLIHGKMGLSDVSRTSIKRCHRLGSQGKDQVRAVLVQFHDHHTKSLVWKSKAKLKGTSFTLFEFLTKTRQNIHKQARKYFGMRNVWTLDGTVYIKLPDSSRAKVTSEEDFNNLVTKYSPGCSPLSNTSPPKTEDSTGNLSGVSQPSTSKCSRQQEVVSRYQGAQSGPSNEKKRIRRVVTKK